MRTLLFILLFPALAYAQPTGSEGGFSGEEQQKLDSLNSIVNNPSSHDTSLAGAYIELSNFLFTTNQDTVIPLCKTAKGIAETALSAIPTGTEGRSLTRIEISLFASLAAALNNIGFIHKLRGDIPKALESYNESLEILEEIGNEEGTAGCLINTGRIYEQQGDIPKALKYYHKSLKIYEEIGKHPDPRTAKAGKKGIAISLNNIGFIYKDQGDIPKALEYYHKCLKILEAIGDKEGTAGSFLNIGVIYLSQGDIAKALEYDHMSLKIQEEIGHKNGIAASLLSIGIIYHRENDLPKALEYYNKSLKILEEVGNQTGIANSLNNIGTIYKLQDDIPKALEYYTRSLKIKEEIGNKKGIANSLNNIGHIHFDQGDLVLALKNGRAGLEIAHEIGSPHLISTNSGLLSKVAKKQGNYQEALEMYELHIQMRDSIKNEETQKATIRQQTKYEFEKAQLLKDQEEKEAARLEAEITSRRDNLQYSIVLICLLVLGAGLLALGRFSIPIRIAEGLIFFSFLIFFEFVLVLGDPYIEDWTGGAPGLKLLINATVAALIFPLHSFFESRLKGRLAARE